MEQVFESRRISFVRVSEQLVPDYLIMINDTENVGRYFAGRKEPYTVEQEIDWVRKTLEENAEVFSMIEKSSGEFIGNIELREELGIALTGAMQNKGYGSEAVSALLEYGFEELKLPEIRLRTALTNARARHVYRKCGFREYDRTDEHLCMEINRDDLRVVMTEKGTALAQELLHFVEECSWLEVRDHVAGLIRDWQFTDWEGMFAARCDGRIVGMASIMKTDYYPLPEIFPWVSCLFVCEDYRGRRISEKLIEAANGYARSLGFSRTYIPSESEGLYEKYGYRYLKDIENYGGGVDHLFVKDL